MGKRCPLCGGLNEKDSEFCTYCGMKLSDKSNRFVFDDESYSKTSAGGGKSTSESDPVGEGPYCLNCGRPVGKGQMKCECSYEFGILAARNATLPITAHMKRELRN